MIEKCGKIKLLAKEYGPHGIYRAIVKCGSSAKESTCFPNFWSPQTVVEKIIEALETVDLTQFPKIGVREIVGVTKEGLKIEMAINLKTLEINTAYPIYELWKPGDLFKKTL